MKEKIMAVGLSLLAVMALAGTASAAWTEYDNDTYGASATVESEPNSPPSTSSPSPADGATGVSVDLSSWSCTVSDPDGDSFDWSIETAPSVGSASGTGESDGTKTCSLSGLSYATTYTVYVNVTDGTADTNDTYTFTTESEPSPSWTEYDSASYGASATVEGESPPPPSWTEYDSVTYNASVTVETAAVNSPPSVTWNSPANGSTGVNTTVVLNVTVSDPDGDTLTVTFQNWTGSVWESINTTVATNGTVTYEWSGLAYNTSYTVRASVNDSIHLVNSDSITFTTAAEGETPNEPPTADFSVSADGLTVAFTDESVDSDGNITGWSWEFGDGSGSSLQNPSHTYSADGTYQVNLTVTDDDGATDTASASLVVSSGGGDSTWGSYDTTLIYVAIGAVVLVAIVALFLSGRRR